MDKSNSEGVWDVLVEFAFAFAEGSNVCEESGEIVFANLLLKIATPLNDEFSLEILCNFSGRLYNSNSKRIISLDNRFNSHLSTIGSSKGIITSADDLVNYFRLITSDQIDEYRVNDLAFIILIEELEEIIKLSLGKGETDLLNNPLEFVMRKRAI